MTDTLWDQPKEVQDKYLNRAEDMLRELLYCSRSWEAWSVGTMSEDDFIEASSHEEILNDTALDLWKIVQEETAGAIQEERKAQEPAWKKAGAKTMRELFPAFTDQQILRLQEILSKKNPMMYAHHVANMLGLEWKDASRVIRQLTLAKLVTGYVLIPHTCYNDSSREEVSFPLTDEMWDDDFLTVESPLECPCCLDPVFPTKSFNVGMRIDKTLVGWGLE